VSLLDATGRFNRLTDALASLFLGPGGRNEGGSSVHRCWWDDSAPHSEATCEASVSGLGMANGIATSTDRRLVFVNDIGRQAVLVFKRTGAATATGAASVTGSSAAMLKEVTRIALPATVDNVEFDEGSGDLMMGSIPSPLLALQAMKDGGRTPVPGGLVVARPGRRVSAVGGHVVDVEASGLVHDGSLLSQVSSGLDLGALGVVLGSPFSDGLLVCHRR
jgi:hypothetical protein